MTEQWLPVKGYEGLYEVSSLGRLRSLDRESCGKHYRGKIHLDNQTGKYITDILCKDGTRSSRRRHRLVAEAFIPNPEGKSDVNHIDGNGHNNCISNLEWTSHKENTDHSWKNGFTKMPPKVVREVDQFNKSGKYIKSFDSVKEAASAVGCFDGDISRCCKGIRKSAGGYIWKYKGE